MKPFPPSRLGNHTLVADQSDNICKSALLRETLPKTKKNVD